MLYYLYGIIKNEPIDDVLWVSFNDISGVIGEVSPGEFGEIPLRKNLESMDWVKDKVLSHEKVIESIMKKTTIIPMKFCTIFNSTERIQRLLEEKHGYFMELLERFKDKHEWGLKIYCNKRKEVYADVPASGREYLMAKKKETVKVLEDELNLNAIIEEIFIKIKDIAEDIRLNRLTPKELLPYKDKEQLVNASLLVSDKNVNRLNDLLKKYIEQGLILELAGPLPVYSFVGDPHADNE